MSGLLPFVRVPAIRAPAAAPAQAWPHDPSSVVRAHFAHVAATRMAGLPFVNPAIEVCVAGCRRIEGDWLAALVTPWCIALVLLPGGGALWQDGAAGERRRVRLPAGELVFVVDAGEAGLPAFQYCPLVAPLLDVADTAAAQQIACDALATALQPQPAAAPMQHASGVGGAGAAPAQVKHAGAAVGTPSALAAGGVIVDAVVPAANPSRRAFLRRIVPGAG